MTKISENVDFLVATKHGLINQLICIVRTEFIYLLTTEMLTWRGLFTHSIKTNSLNEETDNDATRIVPFSHNPDRNGICLQIILQI